MLLFFPIRNVCNVFCMFLRVSIEHLGAFKVNQIKLDAGRQEHVFLIDVNGGDASASLNKLLL